MTASKRPFPERRSAGFRFFLRSWAGALLLLLLCHAPARGEAMLELFQVNWNDLIQKMPELAEAGYTSLWLPPPAKGSSVFSVGYDLFDPFDLGDKDQRGTVATKYGTRAQLQQLVQVAHQFGIRVYFDNIMNHRAFDVPGYNSTTPTNLYPGLRPQDFHLQTIAGGYYRNWPSVQDYGNQWYVQYESLGGLVDLATEPGSVNGNFGPALGGTTAKPSFIRHPGNPEYYMDPAGPSLGGPWRPFYTTSGVPVADDVNAYLIRAVMWTLYTTKCDGFRLDAVKHVPSPFFGASSSNPQADDPTFSGYTGAIQAMYDYVHGYGNNLLANGYVETDGNRNSLFNTEAARNDAMIFGEHLGTPPSYGEYINNGMRLLNTPLRSSLDNAVQGYGSLSGMDQRDYTPYGGAFPASQGVQFAQVQDHALCCVSHRDLHNAYYFMREGLPMIYSDNFNFAGPPSDSTTFPIVPMANYLGEYGDNQMPEVCYLHHQLARGGTRARWSDNNLVAFERYDYRDVSGDGYTNPDATVVLFAMNDNYGYPGDILFDDGIVRPPDGYYGCYNSSPSRGVGLVVGFPPGSVLSQMATTSPGGNRACAKLLVHQATQSTNEAYATANDPNPVNRKVYVGNQTLAPGGGAVELLVPSGGWVMYAYQWPEPSRGNVLTNAITFRQGGVKVPNITVYRRDGANGDPNFGPLYPFKMRGSVDANGNVLLAPGEGHAPGSNNTYAIQVPVLTNAPFDLAVRCDASAASVLVKMDGGLDLNSQMGFGPAAGFDRRDYRPGYASDVFLGYEQALQQFRYGPEKFGARDIARDTVTSSGAETYCYTNGGANLVVNGLGGGLNIKTQTADWVYHDPAATNTASGQGTATQRVPFAPGAGQPVDIWVKSANQFQVDKCFVYYTTNGTDPEGAFGAGRGATQVAEAFWVAADASAATNDWWKATLPGNPAGTPVRYKVALFKGGYDSISTISDADNARLYGLTQFGITNFNPTTARVWLHDDLNTNLTATGLNSGFHIVRARCFLPRSGKSGVFNTFLQTFYYAGQLPAGVIAYPAADGSSITSGSYTVVVRADSSVTEVDYTITDANGRVAGVAAPASPDSNLSRQYPNYPLEYRFTYSPVASSGSATISVRLKDFASSVYPGRFTTLTRMVQASAPATVVQIGSPAYDGAVVTLNLSDTYMLQACFSPALGSYTTNWSLYINGVLQPRSGYIIRAVGGVPGCPGMRSLNYFWGSAPSGTNVVQVVYNNGITLSDTRAFAVARIGDPADSDSDGVPNWMEVLAGTNPYDAGSFLRITGLVPGNPVELSWSSVPNKVYQVFATTNLAWPMAPIPNLLVPADPAGTVTHWFDASPDATNKFYRIQLKP